MKHPPLTLAFLFCLYRIILLLTSLIVGFCVDRRPTSLDVEQGNVINIRGMFEAAKASGYWSALTAVDSNTGQTALHMAALNPSSVRPSFAYL